MYYSQEAKDEEGFGRFLGVQKRQEEKKERQTRRVFPVGMKACSRLLNLERDIPKRGRVG